MIAEQNKQRNSSENGINQIIRAEAKEFISNRLCNGKEDDERTLIENENDVDDADNKCVVEKKENGWIIPKTHGNRKIVKTVGGRSEKDRE